MDAVIKDMADEVSESDLVIHARRELELLGEDPEWIEGILNIVQAFTDMGHSGSSASVAIPMINQLLQYKPLTPLTDDPEDWIYLGEDMGPEPGGIWQNRRDGECFSKDGGVTYTMLYDKKLATRRKPIHISVPSGKK